MSARPDSVIWTLVLILSFTICASSTNYRCGPDNRCKCFHSDTFHLTVDCRMSNLSVTRVCKICDVVENITDLDLSMNNLLRIPDFCFRACKDLRILSLASNKFSDLQNNLFEGLSKLKALNLDDNHLIKGGNFSNPASLGHISELTVLHLQGNAYNPGPATNFLSNIDADTLPTLKEIYLDGIKDIKLGLNFKNFKNLKRMDFAGKYSVCNLGTLHNDTFENIPRIEHLNLALCNLSYIEGGSFEPLHSLLYLNLSFNRELGLVTLRNVSYGLQSTQIQVLDYSAVSKSFGLTTELHRCDVWFLKNTTLKELYLGQNRLAEVQDNALMRFPQSLEVLWLEKSWMVMGASILQLGCLKKLQRLELSYAFKTSNIKYFAPEYKLKEKINENPEACTIPKPKEIDPERQYLDGEHFDLLNFRFPSQLKILNFRYSGIKTSITHGDICCYPIPTPIETLDASLNFIFEWNTVSINFTNLKYLNLSNNVATVVSIEFFKSTPYLTHLDASYNILGQRLSKDTTGQVFKPLNRLEVLNLTSNGITYLPNHLFSSLTNLNILRLASNGIRDVHASLSNLKRLSVLDLHENKISSLPIALLNQMAQHGKGVSIDLSNNSIDISCDNLMFLDWLIQQPSHFKNLNSYIYRKGGTDAVLSVGDLTDIVDNLHKSCKNMSVVIIVSMLVITGFICTILAGLTYRYRWRLRYLYYMAKTRYRGYKHLRDAEERNVYKYDAFISYYHEDYLFVKNELIAELEEKHRLSCCVHQRDFLVGNYIAENILEAIRSSRMTVILLTDKFLKSKWCLYEFNMARMESIYSRDGENVIFCIMLEKIERKHISRELLECLEKETFLEYPDDQNDKPYFWEMLKAALSSNGG